VLGFFVGERNQIAGRTRIGCMEPRVHAEIMDRRLLYSCHPTCS
jgi:hypothetical protein